MNTNNYKVGTVLVCTNSKSPGYKQGNTYIVIEKNNVKGLVGEDSLFDPISQLISAFKPADASTQALRLITKG